MEKIREAAFNDQIYLYANNTVKNIRSHLKTYFLFCTRFGFAPLPASSDCIVCFSQFMSQTVSYPYIKQILSSIKTLHKIYNFEMIEKSSDCFLKYVWVDIDQRVLAQRKIFATI